MAVLVLVMLIIVSEVVFLFFLRRRRRSHQVGVGGSLGGCRFTDLESYYHHDDDGGFLLFFFCVEWGGGCGLGAECTRLEKDRDGCPKIVNLGKSSDLMVFVFLF